LERLRQHKSYRIAIEVLELRINPNDAAAYNNRGFARFLSGDKKGAIEDFQKAADLFQQQGKPEDAQKALDKIKEISGM
jgi:tetratricopeptide (TPR) repeat protein